MAFRASTRLLAAGIQGLSPNATAELAAELLPPLPLYRRLLRVHRKVLPAELRVFGDDYVKVRSSSLLFLSSLERELTSRSPPSPGQAEFRRTRSTDNPLHIVGFLSEWKKYLDYHEAQLPGAAAQGGATAEVEEAVRRERVDEMSRAKPGKALDPSILETVRSCSLCCPHRPQPRRRADPLLPLLLPTPPSIASAPLSSAARPTSTTQQLSADQIGQLYELFSATKDVYLSPEELEQKLAAEGHGQEGIPAGSVLPDLGQATRIGGDGKGEGEGDKR